MCVLCCVAVCCNVKIDCMRIEVYSYCVRERLYVYCAQRICIACVCLLVVLFGIVF